MNQKTFENQLAHACRLTGAVWGCYLFFLGGEWEIVTSVGLNRTGLGELRRQVNLPGLQKWLNTAVISGKSKYRGMKNSAERLNAERLYVFPSNHDSRIFLVGTDHLSSDNRAFFQTFTRDFPVHIPNILRAKFPPKTGEGPLGLSNDIRVELERVLEMASEVVSCEYTVLAIRSGSEFDVYAVRNLNQNFIGKQFSIEKHPKLKGCIEKRRAVALGTKFPIPIPEKTAFKTETYWMMTPLVLSQRVIGVVVFGGSNKYSSEDLKTVEAIGIHVAPSVEKSIVYAESANYLQRFALLNDLAQLASSGFDLYEVVKRVEIMLANTFGSDSSKVWLLDQKDRQYLQHPEGSPELAYNRRIGVDQVIEGSVIETEKVLRIAKIEKRSRYTANDFSMVSKLVAPMRFRGEVTGVLSLESKQVNAFTEHDENLLSVVGSQVASIVENIRLNLETHERASNLLLINEIVRDFLGLTKIPEISDRAARLIAEKFNWDMVLVMILDENLEELVAEGVSGKSIVDIPKGFHFASNLGIPALVLASGESILLKDASTAKSYFPIPGWEPGSGVWVPLRDGEKVFGVINAEFQQKDRVDETDLIVMEAIAGPLSSVIINAWQYEQLQATIAQLRAVRETALDISADLDLEFLLKRVVNRVRQLVDARGAELGLINPQKDEVRVLVSENPWHDYTGYTFPFMEGVAGRVAALGEPLAVTDFNSWSGKSEDTDSAPFTTVAGVPLAVSGEIIGTLSVQDDRPTRGFTDDDIRTLELLAPQLAIFIRNARLYQELEERMEVQRLTEERLVRSAKLAAVGEMAAAVAHELNNPLTTVTGFTELILETMDEESPEYEDLSLVLKEAQRSRDVVRRLLDFSRQSDILRSDTDVNEVISMVLALVHHLTQTGGIAVRVELWDEIPAIRADRNQMQQVILNLIHNAIYSMPKGGELVIESMVETMDTDDWIGIRVMDTGVGINEENMDKIFEPFFTTKPSGEGTGLGLSVSYSIVSEHGGYIEVDSKVDEGSTFTIWLPLTEIEKKTEGKA